jgi:hypothetical protein
MIQTRELYFEDKHSVYVSNNLLSTAAGSAQLHPPTITDCNKSDDTCTEAIQREDTVQNMLSKMLAKADKLPFHATLTP